MLFLNKHGKIYNYAVGIYLLFWQIGRFSFKFLRYEEDFYHFRAFAGHFGDFCRFSRKKAHKCGIRQPRNRAFGDSQGQFGGQSISNFTGKGRLEGRTGIQGPEQNGQAKPQGGLVRDSATADPGTDLTIPEGRASWEIPAYLKKAFPDLNEDRWNKLVQDPKFAQSLGVDASSLEGYLLPDTYPFAIDANEETIIRQMVAANLKLRDEMKDKPNSKWATLGNWHKVLTLASVVEEETGKPDERFLIAGVFHNRLEIQTSS